MFKINLSIQSSVAYLGSSKNAYLYYHTETRLSVPSFKSFNIIGTYMLTPV